MTKKGQQSHFEHSMLTLSCESPHAEQMQEVGDEKGKRRRERRQEAGTDFVRIQDFVFTGALPSIAFSRFHINKKG